VKAKKKLCSGCDSEQFIWKNHEGYKYCRNCWGKLAGKPFKQKKVKPIRVKSTKMQKLDTLYTKLRRVFLNKHPMCQAALPNCYKQSTDIHHKKGRGLYHNDTTKWLSVCRNCHTWIEENPKEAIELGFSIPR
jgi:hypothetical protein